MDFRADFAEDKAKFRRLAGASQEILTRSSVKSAEKTRADFYAERFLLLRGYVLCLKLVLISRKRTGRSEERRVGKECM